MASTLQTIKIDLMNFVSKLETSAGKFASAFARIFGKAPSALQAVENFVSEAAPMVEAAVALADPAAEPAVAAVLATIETGLAGIQAAAAAANSGGGLLQNLQNFATSVPSTLTSLDVKNPALKTKVTGIVNFIVNETKILLPAAENWVKQIAAATAPAK